MVRVPKIFVISLKDTPKRKEYVSTHLKSFGLDFEIFDGFNGNDSGLVTTIDWSGVYRDTKKEIDVVNPYYITPGAIGCFLSHLMLWKTLKFIDSNEFIIFEDDVILSDNFLLDFDNFYKNLPINWNISYLGWIGDYKDDPVTINDYVLKCNILYTTHAYMVKKESLDILIDTNVRLREPLDISMWKNSFPKLNVYASSQKIVDQKSLYALKDVDFEFQSEIRDWEFVRKYYSPTPDEVDDAITASPLFPVVMGNGWFDLEMDSFRWTNGKARLEILLQKDSVLTVNIESHIDNTIIFKLSNGITSEFKVTPGRSTLSVNIPKNVTYVDLLSDTYTPHDRNPESCDTRKLGIIVHNVILNETSFSVNELYFSPNISLLKEFSNKYFFANYVTRIKDGEFFLGKLPDVDGGKLNLSNQTSWCHYRSGWNDVLDYLTKFHSNEGVRFESFIENSFFRNNVPLTSPWCGFIHIPFTFPIELVGTKFTGEYLTKLDSFQESLTFCKGIWTLSEDLHDSLRAYIPSHIPIEPIYYPIGDTPKKFDFESFVYNDHKLLLSIGMWMRKMTTLNLINPPSKYTKIRVLPDRKSELGVKEMIFREENYFNISLTEEQKESVFTVCKISNKVYDYLLTKNVVFLDLIGSSANNVIIECISRGTPLLINRLPPIIEYLGKDYPFYYNSLEEAEEKLNDISLIFHTHDYLMNLERRNDITLDSFSKQFENSEIFKSL